MRILRYGKFLNNSPSDYGYDWDEMPIGMHNAIRRSEEINYKSAHNEYYYRDENYRIHIVRDAHPVLKMFAHLRLRNPHKIVGYVDTSIIDKPKAEQDEIEL